MLDVTRQLYNALLEQRRYTWTARRIALSTKAQYAEITALRHADQRVAAVYRECEDAVLHRLDLAFCAFFRRCKSGEKAGFPRYKTSRSWTQIEFQHGDRALRLNAEQSRLRVPGVGTLKLRKGRAIESVGRAFVSEKNGRWWATFECHRLPEPLPATGRTIGVDRGVHVLCATSEGELIPNRKAVDRNRRSIAVHSRALSALANRQGLEKSDLALNQRRKIIRRLGRAREREANMRLDHAHKVALRLIRENDIIALEKLNLRAMMRSAKGTVERPGSHVRAKAALNRVLIDAGFGLLRRLIGEKAEYAARRVIDVDARYSSRTCARCLHVAASSRRRRRFGCVACGWTCHADVAAALEIRRRAELQRMSELSRMRNPLPSHDGEGSHNDVSRVRFAAPKGRGMYKMFATEMKDRV
jgi:putative transposase